VGGHLNCGLLLCTHVRMGMELSSKCREAGGAACTHGCACSAALQAQHYPTLLWATSLRAWLAMAVASTAAWGTKRWHLRHAAAGFRLPSMWIIPHHPSGRNVAAATHPLAMHVHAGAALPAAKSDQLNDHRCSLSGSHLHTPSLPLPWLQKWTGCLTLCPHPAPPSPAHAAQRQFKMVSRQFNDR
jgi:hypothetical protein